MSMLEVVTNLNFLSHTLKTLISGHQKVALKYLDRFSPVAQLNQENKDYLEHKKCAVSPKADG